MKKLNMMALSIIAIANLSGCATAATTEPAVKAETVQSVEASKSSEAVTKSQAETPATVGKRGFKVPNAATDNNPNKKDKKSLTCVVDPSSGEEVCY